MAIPPTRYHASFSWNVEEVTDPIAKAVLGVAAMGIAGVSMLFATFVTGACLLLTATCLLGTAVLLTAPITIPIALILLGFYAVARP